MVYCQKCGAKNLAGASYCKGCGKQLKQNKGKLQDKKIKEPWIAALLNLLIAGAGFIYLGKWGKAIGFFFLVFLAALIFGIVGAIIMNIITMTVCYQDAKKMNEGIE